MSTSRLNTVRTAALAALLVPALAFASVGKIAVLQGSGTRTPEGGPAVALAVGSELELKDTVKIARGGNAKIVLSDESVLLVGSDSTLVIHEAEFAGLERKGFSASLLVGKVWAKVKKAAAGSEAKFEVTTERAVAGVRGTVFRVDATKLLKAATGGKSGAKKKVPTSVTTVRVTEGKVAVEAEVKLARAEPPSGQSAPRGERRQVAGPQEISKDEWEKKFVELQQNMMVTVGEDSWEVGDLKVEKNDAFAKFVDANDE